MSRNPDPIQNNNSSNYAKITLEGINLINLIKIMGKPVAIATVPTIFKRLGSLNTNMVQNGTTYKMCQTYYYLVDNIPENEIDCYMSVTSNLKEPYVLDLKSFAYTFPNKSLTSYPNQYGISAVIVDNYNNAETDAYKADQKTFQPFKSNFYNGNDFNKFINQYSYLTSFSNTSSSNEQKLYTLLFLAKSTNTLGHRKDKNLF